MVSSHDDDDRAISIGGRMALERERCIGMTDDERAWRAKFLKSQHLAHDEPLMTPEIYKKYFNPLRRLYKAPMNVLEKSLTPIVGKTPAYVIRGFLGRVAVGIPVIYIVWYHLKYNRASWERLSGWRVMGSRPTVLPGDPGYPYFSVKKPNEYASNGFEKSPI
ncbi:NADH dehydrogenase (ubiquinone) B17 subunit [Halictus rubicundus]|uniref:NADH dehydrogenase (ubiquinone) B17 subunit n=1 Tax=Halictus rubicundus TaxID=77578 RepID=UPI0040366103